MQIITSKNDLDIGGWEQFVDSHPNGTVFHLPGFYKAWQKTKKCSPLVVIGQNQEGETTGVMISLLKKDFTFPISLFTRRADVFAGPLVKNNDTGTLELMLKKYREDLKNKAIYSLVRNFCEQDKENRSVFERNGFLYEKHYNIHIDLTIGNEQLWKSLKRNRKDGINKARKQGFVFEQVPEFEDYKTFFSLLKETYDYVKLPYPDISLFKALNTELKQETKWFVLKKNDRPIIILVGFVYKNIFHAFTIGATKNQEILKFRPVDLFYWEVLQWCVNNGCKTFDWMGAGKPNQEYGVRDFKLQYGGELFEPGRYINIHMPTTYRLSLFLFKIWKMTKKQ